jgi:uncharacterized protein YndB with AHSA1/START domain
MVAADGSEAAFHGEYREIVPGERIVCTEVFEGRPQAQALTTVTFGDSGPGGAGRGTDAVPQPADPRDRRAPLETRTFGSGVVYLRCRRTRGGQHQAS